MKNIVARFLQVGLVIVAAGVLTFMLWEPHLEGRNAHATPFEIYFKDPFLALVYVGSIPFFVALYRAFVLIEHARRTGAFSRVTVDGLHAIKRCAVAILCFVAVAALVIIFCGDKEDRPPGIAMVLMVTCLTGSVGIVARSLARRLEKTWTRAAPARD